MPSPLNPLLYARLKEEFGRINVSHAGVAAAFSHTPGIRDRRMRMQLSESGEYYKVNCPFCGDTRGRLWINHLFGVPDEVTGGKNLWLAICYNEGCLSVVGRSKDLYDRLYGFRNVGLRGQPIVILQGDVEEAVLKPIQMPGITLRMDRVPPHDPACKYLYSRGLDPVMLGQTFDVSYCLDATTNYPMAHGRIVIPVYMRNMLVGWQCRYVGDVDWKAAGIPKYYNLPNMPRRLMLYNFDIARQYPFVVITEGPLDVWNVGKQAVAAFGKHLSSPQVQLICENWEYGVVIILLDGDAWEDAEKLAERFRQEQFKGKVVPVQLADGCDPGGLDRNYLWSCINNECARSGIDLTTLRRKDENANTSDTGRNYRCARPNDAGGSGFGGDAAGDSYDKPRDSAAGA